MNKKNLTDKNIIKGRWYNINKKIKKTTKSMVFLTGELKTSDKIVATASGIWKILKLSGAGPGG